MTISEEIRSKLLERRLRWIDEKGISNTGI